MPVVGGDLSEITYNHPTVGSGVLYCKSGEDSTFDHGGLRTSDEANGVDGGGRMIRQMNRTRWSVEITVTWDMDIADEAVKLNELSESPVEAEWTISHVNGQIWRGTGAIVGDIQPNGNTAQMPLKISGGGKLEKL